MTRRMPAALNFPADLSKDKNEDYLAAAELYRHAGYPVICASAQKGIGIEQLRHALENKISVFAGVISPMEYDSAKGR